MKRTILAIALASALILSGCGNKDEEQAKTAISNYFTKQQGGQSAPMKKKDADCLAKGMVDGIGVDQLKKYGLLKKDGSFNTTMKNFKMKKDDSKVLANSFLSCTDVMKTMKSQAAASPAGKTPEGKKCFSDTLTDSNVRTMLVASFSGDQAQARQFQTALMKCASIGAQPTAPAPAQPSPKAPKR